MAVAARLPGGRHQPLDLGRRQVLAGDPSPATKRASARSRTRVANAASISRLVHNSRRVSFSRALLVARLRSHPINAVRPWSVRRAKNGSPRLAQGAAQAELARSYGVSQSTISRLAAPGPFEASAVGA
jgi:hypothetical protein